jgi:tripartite-type tricarboxylate transporter receptor subunit TctC
MKKRIFRDFTLIGFVFILVSILPNNSWAKEKYPTGSIDLFCPFVAGGQTDLVNRALAKGLEKYLGVTVVPGNKPGGGGAISASALANSRPDGYTMAMMSESTIIAPLFGQATYSMDDLRIVGVVASWDSVLVASADSPWKTIQEFVDYAKKNPGVKYAHPGIGSANFVLAENINKNAKLMMVGVPFKGDPEIMAAVLGKHVPLGIFGYMNGKIQADAGKMRILLCLNGYDPTIPSISTAFGKTVPVIEVFYYLWVPKKTPDEIVQVLERALEKVTKDPEYVNALNKLYVTPHFVDSKTCMQKMLPQKISLLKAVIQPMGLTK